MLTRAFNHMRELEAFVNENKIKKEDIVNVFQNQDGLYELICYVR